MIDKGVIGLIAALAVALLAIPLALSAIAGNISVGVAIDAMLILFGIVLGSYTAGARFTRSTMATGADLVLKAQESDDRRDVMQMKVLGDVMRAGGQIAQRMRPSDAPAALPLPSQGMEWLPPVAMLEDADLDVIDAEAWGG